MSGIKWRAEPNEGKGDINQGAILFLKNDFRNTSFELSFDLFSI